MAQLVTWRKITLSFLLSLNIHIRCPDCSGTWGITIISTPLIKAKDLIQENTMTRVVSCRFLRLRCTDDDHPLFRRTYARSNRERGTKLLRCFPHCCPEHIKRCYCGCSIHVQVTFATNVPIASQENLVVCARFEPSRMMSQLPLNTRGTNGEDDQTGNPERKFQPGDVVSLPESIMYPKSRYTKQTVWIRADREDESKQTTKNTILYVLNNHRFPKWFYSYDTSFTRTQREFTHHLVVYIFELINMKPQLTLRQINATVLARHESPGFTLISYRRSGTNFTKSGCELPAVGGSSATVFAAIEGKRFSSSSNDIDMDLIAFDAMPARRSRHTGISQFNYYLQSSNQHNFVAKDERRYHDSPRFDVVVDGNTTMKATNDTQPRTAVDNEADEYLWQKEAETRMPGFREKMQHLLILWRFLQCVTFRDLKFRPDRVETHLHALWLRIVTALSAPPYSCNVQVEESVASFLTTCEADSVREMSSPDTNPQDLVTIRTSVYLFLRVLSSQATHNLFRRTCQTVTTAVQIPWFRHQFVVFALDLYDIVSSTVHEISKWNTWGHYNSSLPRLVDNVLSLVYGRTGFSFLRTDVSSLLLDRQVPGSISDTLNQVLRAFVVQLQEFSIASVVRHRHIWDGMGSGTTMQSLWNHRWILNPGCVSLNAIKNGRKRDARLDQTLVMVAQLVQEFGGIDITVSGRDSLCMALRSTLSFDDTMTMAPMELILDGQLRGFRVLPSGISSILTTVGGWTIGDYEAIVSNDGQCLTIHFFAFIEGEMTRSVSNRNSETERHMSVHTTVRRASLSLVLEQASGTFNSKDSMTTSGNFILVSGTVLDATYCHVNSFMDTTAQNKKLSAMSTRDRGKIWSELKWTPVFEVQAGYTAL